MSIVLAILGVIGKVLLVLLIVLLVLIALILFAPVRYEADGKIDDPKGRESFDADALKGELSGSFRFRWLFGLISGGISWPDAPEFTVKIARWKIHLPGEKEKDKPDNAAQRQLDEDLKNRAEGNRKSAAPDGSADPAGSAEPEKSAGPAGTEDTAGSDTLQKTEAPGEPGGQKSPEDTGEPDGRAQAAEKQTQQTDREKTGKRTQTPGGGTGKETSSEDKESLFERILDFVTDLPDLLSEKTDAAAAKLEKIRKKVRRVLKILEAPSTGRAVSKIRKVIGKVLSAILPKTWTVRGTAGLGDPAMTGRLLGITGMLYPWTEGRLKLAPEMELWRFDLEGHARGKVHIVSLVGAALALVLDKDVRTLIGRIRNKDGGKKKKKRKGSRAA